MAPDADTRTVDGRDGAPETGLQAHEPFRGYSTEDRALGEYAALIAKDRVTSVVRAPFTREDGPAPGTPEVEERPRGRRLRRAVGELLTCPFCLSQWVAGGFTAGLLLAPRPTRVVVATFDMVALSDFLQVAYRAAEKRKRPE
jgi:hypothetical protein